MFDDNEEGSESESDPEANVDAAVHTIFVKDKSHDHEIV